MKSPLIDFCLYSKKFLNSFVEANPSLKKTTQIKDADGYHVLFYADDFPGAQRFMNGEKEMGYSRLAPPEMVLIAESFNQKPPNN